MAKAEPDEYVRTPRLTTGELYTGNQQYQGLGVVKFCPKCNEHRSVGGGHMANVMGGRHWICSMHPKKLKVEK